MEYTGERMVPEKTGAGTVWEHIYRYRFALRFVRGKDVLDIACGEGYGTAAIAKAGARSVIGVDISEEACAHARQKYGIDARCGNAIEIPLPEKSVDTVVSYETVEHVTDPRTFLAECRRVLRPSGLLVISTPNKDIYSIADCYQNPFHCSEMSEDEFVALLREGFKSVRLYSQHLKYAAWWSLRSLTTPFPGIGNVRGYYRLKSMFPNREWSYIDDQTRNDILNLILKKDSFWVSLTNPYAIHKRCKWTQEQATYYIAVARRPIVG